MNRVLLCFPGRKEQDCAKNVIVEPVDEILGLKQLTAPADCFGNGNKHTNGECKIPAVRDGLTQAGPVESLLKFQLHDCINLVHLVFGYLDRYAEVVFLEFHCALVGKQFR